MDQETNDGLCSIFYISRLTVSATQIDSIIRVAGRNNRDRDITGGLLFTGRYFAQVLEGPTDTIASTMQAIVADTRHSDITTLSSGPVVARRFRHWSMGFVLAPAADRLVGALMDQPDDIDAQGRLNHMLSELIESRAARF